MKVFFGCFLSPERAERLRNSGSGTPEELEMYLEDYPQGVMVRPPGASLDLDGDVHISNGCVPESWLLDQLSGMKDVKSVIQFTRASHDRDGTISRMLYSLGDYNPRTRIFDDRSPSTVVLLVKADYECAVHGGTTVQDIHNLSDVGKNEVIVRLRETLRALGHMFMPMATMENALGVLESCDDIRYSKVIDALKDACLGDAVPGLTAPGSLV
jgi:hypothetical protein